MNLTKSTVRYTLELSETEFHDLRALFAAPDAMLHSAFAAGSQKIEPLMGHSYATYNRYGLIDSMRELQP